MPRLGFLARRSVTEWGIRIALAAGMAWLGYGAATHALAQSLRRNAVEQAHMLAPGDGRIAAALSERRLGAGRSPARLAEAEQLARAALRREPTAVAAVTTLGLGAQIRGDLAGARRMFAYSQKLSRRDLGSHLWAIEDAVARDDIPDALRHYDLALRTSRTAPNLLFPVLAAAIDDRAIRFNLIRTLARKPGWAEYFIDHTAANSPHLLAAVGLLQGLASAGVPVSDVARFSMVNRLVAGDQFDAAWTYYASLRPGADRRASRDGRFTANLANPLPFDWAPVSDAGISTAILGGEGGGIVEFAARPSVGGPVLRQMQMLPPGAYRLEGRSIGVDQMESARPYWALTCRGGRELGRVVMPNSAQAQGAFFGRFDVPSGCPVQMLELVARPSDAVSGAAGQIVQARLYPAR